MGTVTIGDISATILTLLTQEGPKELPAMAERLGAQGHLARELVGIAFFVLKRRHQVHHQNGVWAVAMPAPSEAQTSEPVQGSSDSQL